MFAFKPLLLICALFGLTIMEPCAQSPVYPSTYTTNRVTFESRVADVVLEGTVTIPEGNGPFPGVVLVAGYYPIGNNIDKFGFHPFVSIADYLSRNGIAVLRYEEREPLIYFWHIDNLTTEETSEDIHYALDFLETFPRIDPKKTGIIGFGEGGLQAAIVAANNPKAKFVVSLAGIGITGKEIIASEPGVTRDVIEIIENEPDNSLATFALQRYFFEKYPNTSSHFNDSLVSPNTPYFSNWYRFYLFTDPAMYWNKVTVPVLALHGSLDSFIPAEQNLNAIGTALREGGNSNITIMELPNINHFFQYAETGSPSEYFAPGETFSPETLEIMEEWIFKTTTISYTNEWFSYQ